MSLMYLIYSYNKVKTLICLKTEFLLATKKKLWSLCAVPRGCLTVDYALLLSSRKLHFYIQTKNNDKCDLTLFAQTKLVL